MPAKLRRETIILILQLGKQIQLRPELPNDQEGPVLIFRQKASYLLFYTYPKQVIFPSPTTLEELFSTMLEKAKDFNFDLPVKMKKLTTKEVAKEENSIRSDF